ncbi:MAG: DUF1211 domain-containing protein [Streptococcaceae bacterium]|jgi:uncharacterized membrane protein|nr:DUF1211 domain-containing protein [Streptococcaceae bacterium]
MYRLLTKNRLESFTDGVIAIVLTVLIFNVKFPNNPSFSGALQVGNLLLAYMVTFIFIAAIWVNHHQVFARAKKINIQVIWANLFWLFWVTLCPSVTLWVGKYPMEVVPGVCYALVYFMWSVSFSILTNVLGQANSEDKTFKIGVLQDKRSRISIFLSVIAVVAVPFFPPIAVGIRFIISALWIFSPISRNHIKRGGASIDH